MADNERWDVYDNKGEKIGEIRPESDGFNIGKLVSILLAIVCLAVIGPWIYIISAAVQGDDTMQVVAGLSLVSAIIIGEKIPKAEWCKTFWKRCIATIVGAGMAAGIVMALLQYLGGKMPGMSGVVMIPVMMIIGILPATVVTLLLNTGNNSEKE